MRSVFYKSFLRSLKEQPVRCRYVIMISPSSVDIIICLLAKTKIGASTRGKNQISQCRHSQSRFYRPLQDNKRTKTSKSHSQFRSQNTHYETIKKKQVQFQLICFQNSHCNNNKPEMIKLVNGELSKVPNSTVKAFATGQRNNSKLFNLNTASSSSKQQGVRKKTRISQFR